MEGEEEPLWKRIFKFLGFFILSGVFIVLFILLVVTLIFYGKYGKWPDVNDIKGFFGVSSSSAPVPSSAPATSGGVIIGGGGTGGDGGDGGGDGGGTDGGGTGGGVQQIYSEGETVHLSLTSLMGTFKPESDNVKVEFYPPRS